MKKCLLFFLAAALLLSLTAYGEKEPDYDKAGTEAITVLAEMVDHPDYMKIILMTNAEIDAIRQSVNTGDYDRPVAVYSLKMKDVKAWVESNLDGDTRESWNSLPATLQEQILNRMNIQSYCSRVNSLQGPETIAFSSAANAVVRNDDLTVTGGDSRLYIFEKGTPILVNYGYHSAGASFVFLTPEQTANQEALQKALPELEITPVAK